MLRQGPNTRSHGHVPDSHRLVMTSRSEMLTIGAERHAPNRTEMPTESPCLPAGGNVPYRDLADIAEVAARRGQLCAIGAKRHAHGRSIESAKSQEHLAGLDVPDFDRLIDPCRREPLTVAGECDPSSGVR